MPLYEYKCEKCGERFEAISRIADRDAADCPECGAPAEKMISVFALGGSGGGSTSDSYSGGGGGGGCWGGG